MTGCSLTIQLVLTGPTAKTNTATLGDATTSASSNDVAHFTETNYAGGGSTAGAQVAGQIGGSPLGSAEHLRTSPASLYTSSGLMWALGGDVVRGSRDLARGEPGCHAVLA